MKCIKKFFTTQWAKLLLNLPFRMFLGRLGIRLMAAGRFLQVRYANWNNEFRLRFRLEVQQLERGSAVFDVSCQVTQEAVLSFPSPNSQFKKQTRMVQRLFSIQGVRSVILSPYAVNIAKGEVFSWAELRPEIERVILEELVFLVPYGRFTA